MSEIDPRFIRRRKQQKNKKQANRNEDERFDDLLNQPEFQEFTPQHSNYKRSDQFGRNLNDKRVARGHIKTSTKLQNISRRSLNQNETPKQIVDLARGLGVSLSSDNSGSSSSDSDFAVDNHNEIETVFDESDDDIIPISMGANVLSEQQELDERVILDQADVPTLLKPTERLAVVNLDWDAIDAQDIMRILSAFKPKDGAIKSISIYPSEFGVQRMEQESAQGPPREIFKNTVEDDNAGDDDTRDSLENGNGASDEIVDDLLPGLNDNAALGDNHGFDEVALRKYQMERLRYFYAVVITDSKKTANAIYRQCDELEFEHSALKLDLRFVPDDQEFDREPREVCTVEQYASTKASSVETLNKMNAVNSMGYTSLKCSWDEDLPDRKVMRRKWTKEELKDMDFNAYLASEDDIIENDSDNESKNELMRQKYLDLLNGKDSDDGSIAGDQSDAESQKSMEQDMQITFAPALDNVADNLLESKKRRDLEQNETVFEKYVREKREQRQAHKAERKLSKVDIDPDNQENGVEFFANDAQNADRQQAELELVIMDDSGKRPLQEDSDEDYRKPKLNRKEKKLLKKKLKAGVSVASESVATDSRFSAILANPDYAMDPTASKFNSNHLTVLPDTKQYARTSDDQQNSNDHQGKQELKFLVDKIKRKGSKRKTQE